MTQFELIEAFVKAAIVIGALQGSVPILVWVERRGSALIQERLGPNRVGPFGLFQPLVDAVKLFFKEDLIPKDADRFLFVLAPALALIPALSTFSVIPFGPPLSTDLFGLLDAPRLIKLQVADVNVGFLVVLALLSTGVYSTVLAGWASNNKYSLRGGIRSSAQVISYELAMALAIVGVVLPVGSLMLPDVVEHQRLHLWTIFTQPLGFLVFYISTFAETNRLPFDLPEAEAELVAGFHTEYSSMKFALFFMAEYANMVTSAAFTTTLFLGGWSLPFVPAAAWQGWLGVAFGVSVFVAKVAVLLWIFVWVRWTLPRYRYDQLMRLGWKVLIPLAALNLIWAATATLLDLGWF